MNVKKAKEDTIHFIFLILGLIAVGSVLVITIYLVISGLPAIREIGVWSTSCSERAGPPRPPSRNTEYFHSF